MQIIRNQKAVSSAISRLMLLLKATSVAFFDSVWRLQLAYNGHLTFSNYRVLPL
jgi:hypothetical protein